VYVNHNDPQDTALGIIKVLSLNHKDYKEISIKLRERIVSNFSFKNRKEKIKKIISELNQE